MLRKTSSLRSILDTGELIIAPGVFDLITARVADSVGFRALYVTGYGISASYLGLPDAGLATLTDMVDRIRAICEAVDTPVIADADTGYGGLINLRHTVRQYERAGATGIQIEDQVSPKKCGHTPGRQVIPLEDMVTKIKVALESRGNDDTLIIARTDARTGHGLDEALRRGEAYRRAGADVVFVESPQTEEELARIGSTIDAPLVANMVEFGVTPVMPAERLKAMGFNIVIYPGLALAAVAEAARKSYSFLKDNGSTLDIDVPLYGPETSGKTVHQLVGFEDVWEFERRWAEL